MIKLSVVVPCYNEEKRLEGGFRHYLTYLNRKSFPWELIFVNDGSKDKTEAIIKKLSTGNKNIKIAGYSKNRGKGYAIKEGIKQARGELILFSDIDHSVRIETVEKFFESFKKGNDVAIGSRRVPGSKILVHQDPVRELLGRGFSLLVSTLVYWGIKDATCGFKAFKKEAAKKIFSKIKIYDWAFDAEILFLCKKYNFKLAQVPVNWSNAKGSKVSLGRDVFGSFVSLVKIHVNNLQGKY